jgi:hypothetical protein
MVQSAEKKRSLINTRKFALIFCMFSKACWIFFYRTVIIDDVQIGRALIDSIQLRSEVSGRSF